MTHVEIAPSGSAQADARAVPVAKPLDSNLDARLAKLGETGDLRGDRGEALLLHLDGERLVAAGVGERDKVDADALRTAGAVAASALSRVGGTIAWQLDDSLPVPVPEQAAALVEGTILGAYSPGLWKSKNDTRQFEKIVIEHEETPELRAAVERAALLADRANRARDVANMPPNELTPATLAEEAEKLAAEHEHLTAEALGVKEMEELGMGSLLAVGQGSRNEPRLIVLRYDPPNAVPDVVLGLVGKSITFDTGGISIKPASGMQAMKGDMSGGAGTLHGIGALAALGVPVRAIALLAAAENMPGGGAFRPGDILKAANGKTIEVINTDAEGRLVLADALWYARREGATHVRRHGDADRRDVARARRPLLRHLRERRRVARPNRCRGESEWRPRMAVPAPHALPPVHRFRLCRHEERLDTPRGLALSRGGVPPRVRGRRPVGSHRLRRPGLHRPEPRRLSSRRRRNGLGRAAHR